MLEIRLLGQFDVRLNGAPVDIPSRPAQSLFAYLLLNPDVAHRRERLAGLLWPEATDANARGYLRKALWHLRKAVSPGSSVGRDYWLVDDIAIAFDANAEYWLDTAVLARQPDSSADLEALMQGVAVYRGELLPGFYDEWAVLERERLRAIFEQKMNWLLECLVAAGSWSAVLEWGEHWIALGGAPEPAYRALIVAHGRLGDLASAAAVFQRCVEGLGRELGVEPSEQTQAVYAQLRAGGMVGQLAIAALLAVHLELPAAPVQDELPAPGLPPFKGLQYFEQADSDLFFGREQLTASFVAYLQQHPFLAIVGASGSGKSSLVRAGLVPALEQGQPPDQRNVVFLLTPTARPLEALATCVARGASTGVPTAALVDDLAHDPSTLLYFLRQDSNSEANRRRLFVVDQFEELFTLCRSEPERQAFLDNLLMAASDVDGLARVVIALRADFYAHCAEYPDLRAVLSQHQDYIGPMSAEELRRAIEEPALAGSWEFEAGLVPALLRDAGDTPGALPLLSHALLETWNRRRGRRLTFQGYAESGGVHGAIAKTAETVYNHQLNPDQQRMARQIFLRLTELGEGTQDTRRRAALSELVPGSADAPAVEAVLRILADARLITTGAGTAEVAHEALIREWPSLRQWLTEDREGLRLHRHLTEAAQAWDELDRDPNELYRGPRLAQALVWAAAHASALNTLEREFLDASHAQAEGEAAEREAARQRELVAAQRLAAAEKQRAEEGQRSAQQLRRRAYYLAAAFVLALVLAGAALWLGNRALQAAVTAQADERVASSRELAAAAVSSLDTDPERSILLALQAISVTYSVDKTWTAEAEQALHRAIGGSRLELTLRGHAGPIYSVAYSADGKRIATASVDGTAKIWDAANGQMLLTLSTGATNTGQGIAFSPDGTHLATVGADDTVLLWSLAGGSAGAAANGQQTHILRGHTSAVFGIAFSPDSMRLATASQDRTARVWDVATGQELLTLRGHSDAVGGVDFSPDGSQLATSSVDGTVKVWSLPQGPGSTGGTTTGKLLLSLPGGGLGPVVFSPDGMRLAATDGNSIRLWDPSTGHVLQNFTGHTNNIVGLAFSPDGGRLATSSLDRKAIVWDASRGVEIMTLSGHTGAVETVAFSPDGGHLITASDDGTARVWQIGLSRELFSLPTPGGSAGRVVYSPDGTRLAASVGTTGTVHLWDAATGQEQQTLAGNTSIIWAVAFSPDGKRLAAALDDGTALVWDLSSHRLQLTLHAFIGAVNGVAFSADGKRVATAAQSGVVAVWDAASGQKLVSMTSPNSIETVAFSPDSKRLATGNDNGIGNVWDASSGSELLAFRGHKQGIVDVAFNPAGTRVATASRDGTAKIWDAATGRELLTLSGHTSDVQSVAFSPDGKRVATASRDGTAKVWDVATGAELLTLSGDGQGLNGATFSPDGMQLATAGDDAVRAFVLPIEPLETLARTRVTRSLTAGECRQYLHVAQCTGEAIALSPTAASLPGTATLRPVRAQGTVCEVTDVLGLNDQALNQATYQGVLASAEKFGWKGHVLESQQPGDYDRNINAFIQSGCDLIIAPEGLNFGDTVRPAAQANPNQKFLILDWSYDPPLTNVWAEEFATDQAAFLAGYIAASANRTGKVGTFGGIAIPPVIDFMNGFALGVAYYNQHNGAQVEVLGWDLAKQDGLFTNNFTSIADGHALGGKLLDQGADIILPVAAVLGLGAAAAVKEHGQAYVIGVDNDWALRYPEYADVVLTSIEKGFDVTPVEAVKAIVDGTFTGGTHIGTLENGEVGLAPFHSLDSLVSAKVKADLEQIKAGIVAGEIKTKP